MPLSNGQILQSRYRILRPLGQGGMGAVYLAEDLRLNGRMCAVKENVPDPAATPQALAQIRQQFQAEAGVLANLDHPNLPKVSDYFSDGGNEYIVMDYVAGEDLASLLARQGSALPEQSVLSWADQVLDALEYLHSQHPNPIIHRDIKPANLILTPQGRIKLVDFGLVKLLDLNNPATATAMKGLGTPEYAPLEQYSSGAGHTDARSDIYSLGSTIYHLLTNVSPPDATQRVLNPSKLLLPRQINPGISTNTEAAILKAMEIRPDQRYQTARELRQALKQTQILVSSLPVPPGSSRLRRGILAAVGGLLLFACVALGLLLPRIWPLAGATLASTVTPIPLGVGVTPSPALLTLTPTLSPTPERGVPTETATVAPVTAPARTSTVARALTPTRTPRPTAAPTATSRPSATFTVPLPVSMSASEAISEYYALIGIRQYDAAWEMSADYNRASGLSFNEYVSGWEKSGPAYIQDMSVVENTNDATVTVTLSYPKHGATHVLRYTLERDMARGTERFGYWVFVSGRLLQ